MNNLSVWLANVAFTDTRATYAAGSFQGSFNQNTASNGWHVLGNALCSGPGTACTLQVDHGNGRTGADLVGFDLGFAATSSASDESMSCGFTTPVAGDVAAIQRKMLNAVDNYRDVRGAFHIAFSNNGQDEQVEFAISEENLRSFVRTTPREGAIEESVADGTSALLLYPERSMFQKKRRAPIVQREQARHFFNQACQAVYVARQDRAWAHAAHEVTLPSNYAFWLTGSDSKIVGHEVLLGRNVTSVAGRHDWYSSTKLGATGFKMWVDDETGTLLKLSGTNEHGRIVYAIDVSDIQFDRGVALGEFALDEPAGWTNIE
ncbi:hypothetical protein LZC95_25785 [Pendulispora brunnea]|uniref:Uncharacterized protein n=1 Tax=Pendulispora brunnea TaxID=2905690 RepID=A0ABZ2JZF0_9BACT